MGGKTVVSLVKQLRKVAKMGLSDDDCLMLEAADRIEKLETALGEKITHNQFLPVAFPPETKITVNGKTFLLRDIDKEMAE